MKTIILGTLISVFSLAALAEGSADTQTITIDAMSPKYDVTQGVRAMSPDEFGKFTGSYDLSNGKSLSLFTRGQKKYAVINGEAWHEIVATRDNTFVSTDKQLKMTIARAENGDARGELLITEAQPQVALQTQPAPQVQPVAHVTPRKKSKQMVAHAKSQKSRPVLTSTQMVASR